MADFLNTLRWQYELTWRLAELHLSKLSDEACLWSPRPDSWTVHQGPDGRWHPDWADKEPDPLPTTSIAWLTWHLLWWWSGLLAAVKGERPVKHDEIPWPGNSQSTVTRLRALSAEWDRMLAAMHEGDLDRPLAFPWHEPRPLRLAVAWANCELMKNVAEIGSMRLLFEASRPDTLSHSKAD